MNSIGGYYEQPKKTFNGLNYFGEWTIKHNTNDNKKFLYFFNHNIDMSFTVNYEDIKECLNKIYQKVKI